MAFGFDAVWGLSIGSGAFKINRRQDMKLTRERAGEILSSSYDDSSVLGRSLVINMMIRAAQEELHLSREPLTDEQARALLRKAHAKLTKGTRDEYRPSQWVIDAVIAASGVRSDNAELIKMLDEMRASLARLTTVGATFNIVAGADRAKAPSRGLSFKVLRDASVRRLPLFKNNKGKLAHVKDDGSDWSPAQWFSAVVNELGEYAGYRKKYERGDITFAEFAAHAARELADVQTYLDILAMRCLDNGGCAHAVGIDLGKAVIDKFNEVSERVGADVFIETDGSGVFTKGV